MHSTLGGFENEDKWHSYTEYLTKTGKWDEGAKLPQDMSSHCQVTVGSDVYVLGRYHVLLP